MTTEDVGGFSATQDGVEGQSLDSITSDAISDAPEASGQGQADDDGAVDMAPAAFNVDEYGDHMATVSVNGEELQVPVKEALAGYQRQQAFTQGMQEVSGARALQTALENPATRAEALQLINSRYGQAAAEEAAEASAADDAGGVHERSDVERQLDELKAWRAGIELDETIDRLQTKYGEAFVPNEVFEEAINRGVQDASGLEQVFQTMKFESFFAAASATEQAATARSADDAARQAAARAAAEVVSSGNGVSAGSLASTTPKYSTFEQAAEAAWASDAPFKL